MPETDTSIIEFDHREATESTEPVGSPSAKRGGRWGGRIAAITTALTLVGAGIGIGVSKASSADSDRPPGVEQVDKLHHMRQLATDIGYQELLPLLAAENKPESFTIEGEKGSKLDIISLREGFEIDKDVAKEVVDRVEERIGTRDMIDPYRSGKEKEYVREARDPDKPHVMFLLPPDAPLPSWQELNRVGSGAIVSTLLGDDAIVSFVRFPTGDKQYGDTEQFMLNKAFAVEVYQSLVNVKPVVEPEDLIGKQIAQSSQEIDAVGHGTATAYMMDKRTPAQLNERVQAGTRFDANSTSTNAIDSHFLPPIQELLPVYEHAPQKPVFKKVKK